MGFASKVHMERGDQFVVRLVNKGQMQVPLLYSVVHTHREPAGTFMIGAEFVCVLRNEDIDVSQSHQIDQIQKEILS